MGGGGTVESWKPAKTYPSRQTMTSRAVVEMVKLDLTPRCSAQLNSTSYTDEKTIIKTLTMQRWRQQLPNSNQSDSFHRLNRPQQVILFRMRTGHNRLNATCTASSRLVSKMCPCNADIMTVEHLLQHCQLHDALRRYM